NGEVVRIGDEIELSALPHARKRSLERGHLTGPGWRELPEVAEENRPIRVVENETARGFDGQVPRQRRSVGRLERLVGIEAVEDGACQLPPGKNDRPATGEHDFLRAAELLVFPLASLEPEMRHRNDGGFVAVVDDLDHATQCSVA